MLKGVIVFVLISVVFGGLPPLPGCQTFHDNQCSGNQIITPDNFENRRWFTPRRGDPDWIPSFQDYANVVAYTALMYNSERNQAEVQVRATVRDPTVELKYVFDNVAQLDPNKTYDTSYTGVLSISVVGSDGSQIDLEPVDFLWNAPAVVYQNPSGDYRNGQKGAIVEMFGWPHADIEKECQTLGAMGYLGVKVYPAQEQIMAEQPFNNVLNPWYFMYQPVSYRLQGRMGTRDDLRNMIQTCRKYGVRVYADAVVNHMVGGGNDANPNHRNDAGSCTYWPNKNSSLPGGHSPFYTQDFTYTYGNWTNEPPSQEFPAAGYGPLDFHCERPLNSWNDPLDLNAGWLSGLVDLNTERDNVQERIAAYMTDLLSIGISGFRIDAAKHIQPDDLVGILSKFRRNMGGSYPEDFITWLEILLGGESDLLMCNNQSGYNFGGYLADALLNKGGLSWEDLNKVKIWNSGYPKETGLGVCTISEIRSAIQNDDADQQMPGSTSRDMGDQGCILIKNCNNDDQHRYFEQKLFNSPNGVNNNDNDFPIRLILSSFWWSANNGMGIPDGKSDCSLCTITCGGCVTTTYTAAYDPNSCGYDQPGYTRTHRDKSIIIAMRGWMHLSTNPTNQQLNLPANC